MSEKIELPEEHISISTKTSFAFATLANNILNGLVFGNITFFYNQKLGADATLLTIGWFIFAFWNVINDPIASYFIDNTRTKIGRRIPYIRYGSFIYAFAFILCWIPIAPLDNQFALFLNFIFVLFFLDTMFSIVGCCFFCLPAEIAITAKGRTSLGIYTSVIGFINILIGFIVPIVLLTGQEGIPDIFYPVIIIFALLCAVILFGTSYFYKENMFAQLQPHEPFIEGIKLTFKNKPFWIFMIPAFFLAIVLPMFQTGLLYYVQNTIGGLDLILLLFFLIIGIVIGMAFNVNKMPQIGPKKIMIINLSVITIAFIILFMMGQFTLFAWIPGFFAGIGFAGAMVSNGVLMGDNIDNDELITGKRREAIYGGVNAIVTKPSLSIANGLFLFLLGSYGIFTAFFLIPAIFTGISILALYWYPLDGPEWLKKKKYIFELHEKKEQEYLQKLAKEGKLKYQK